MLLEHERNYDLGMDALVTVCSWNTNGIMIWAWMLWSPYAHGTPTETENTPNHQAPGGAPGYYYYDDDDDDHDDDDDCY